mgnify:CR=1 FL=1
MKKLSILICLAGTFALSGCTKIQSSSPEDGYNTEFAMSATEYSIFLSKQIVITENVLMTRMSMADKLAEGIDILTMLVDSKLCTTRSDARRMVQQGGVSVNGKKVDAIDATFGKADFDDKDRILLKKGKKKFCQIKEK